MTNIFNKIQPGPNCAECERASSCPALKLQEKLASIASSDLSSGQTLATIKKEMTLWSIRPALMRKRLAQVSSSLSECSGAEEGKRRFAVGSVMGDNAKDGMNLVVVDIVTQPLAHQAGIENTSVVFQKPTLPSEPEDREFPRAVV